VQARRTYEAFFSAADNVHLGEDGKLRSLGGSLTPAQVLHTLKQILMVEVWFDLRRGGQICLPRITQPEAPAQLILHRLGWSLPEQPPPRIYRDQTRFVGTT